MAKTILIVEDNKLNMKLFEQLLLAKGYDVVKSYDGTDALELVQSHPIDLILMDITLPQRSGMEITKELKSTEGLKDIPVVAVTGLSTKGDEKRIRNAGCDDYIPKPISVPLFLKIVEKHLS